MTPAGEIEDNTAIAPDDCAPHPIRDDFYLVAPRDSTQTAHSQSPRGLSPETMIRDLARARRHYGRAVPQRTTRGRPRADES